MEQEQLWWLSGESNIQERVKLLMDYIAKLQCILKEFSFFCIPLFNLSLSPFLTFIQPKILQPIQSLCQPQVSPLLNSTKLLLSLISQPKYSTWKHCMFHPPVCSLFSPSSVFLLTLHWTFLQYFYHPQASPSFNISLLLLLLLTQPKYSTWIQCMYQPPVSQLLSLSLLLISTYDQP